MNPRTSSTDLEAVVGDAVQGFLHGRLDARPQAAEDAQGVVHLPIVIGSDEDLADLVQWLRRLCANRALSTLFAQGGIALELRLATASAREAAEGGSAVAAPLAPAAPAAPQVLDEAVVTEAVLRRQARRGQPLTLRAGAVITPSARDYARSAGIRMEQQEGGKR